MHPAKPIESSVPCSTTVSSDPPAISNSPQAVAAAKIAQSLVGLNLPVLVKPDVYVQGDHVVKKPVDNTALSEAFLQAAGEGDLQRVKECIERHLVHPSYEGNRAICMSAAEGRLEVVTYLVKNQKVNPSVNNDFPLRWAALKGHAQIVRFLLSDSRVDPSSVNNNAIEWACKNGHYEVVRLLLSHPKVNPVANNNLALKSAVENGHTRIVQVLINDQRINPAVDNNTVILKAIEEEQYDIVTLLLLDGRYMNASNGAEIRERLIELAESSQRFNSKLTRMYNIAFDKLSMLFQGLSVVGSTDLLQDIAVQGGVTQGLFPLCTESERKEQFKQLVYSMRKKEKSA